MRFVQPVITKRARRHQSYKRIKGCMLQAFTDERWWSAKRDRDTTGGRIWTWGSGREREPQESSEREHTHYLNATLCARSMQPLRSCARATVILPFSFLPSVSLVVIFSAYFPSLSFSLSRTHTFFLSIFRPLSAAYSECCPTTVKWTIFGSSASTRGEAAVRFFPRRGRF